MPISAASRGAITGNTAMPITVPICASVISAITATSMGRDTAGVTGSTGTINFWATYYRKGTAFSGL